jgi:hypothetical protein
MFEKLSNSWQLVKSSAEVLQADKELLLFPLISGVAVILVTVGFFVPTFLVGGMLRNLEGAGMSTLGYVLLFAYYLVQYTVIFFFNSALVGAAMIRLDGGDPTVKDGLRIAMSKLGPILGYAAIAATVGLVLRALSRRSRGLGQIVVGLVGMAWNLATFLVVPVLVTHNIGPIDAIKESARTLKRTWGEQIAGNVGLGLAFGLVWLALGLIGAAAAVLAASLNLIWLVIAVVAVFAVVFVLLALVQAALSGIYSAALYRFATRGEAGTMFERQELEAAFVPR